LLKFVDAFPKIKTGNPVEKENDTGGRGRTGTPEGTRF
jgi:hypothetical protein